MTPGRQCNAIATGFENIARQECALAPGPWHCPPARAPGPVPRPPDPGPRPPDPGPRPPVPGPQAPRPPALP